MAEIYKCEVCGSSSLVGVLNIGTHPMCDDLIPLDSNLICEEFPIEILFCDQCNTAHQRYQVPKNKLFPLTYHYRSRFTKDVLTGMENLVDSVATKIGRLENKVILDIGCNDGSLLDFFRKFNCVTLGIEPTGAADDAIKNKHIVYKEYFSRELATKIFNKHGNPDIITFTNVFAHIEDLPSILDALNILVGKNTILVIENHYLGSILNGFQFDTFYHEHPRTYSLKSFVYMCKSLNANIFDVDFPSRYGGNIRVFISKSLQENTHIITEVLKNEIQFTSKFKKINSFIESWKNSKKEQLEMLLQRYGPIKAKAFPGRAAILIKILNLNEKMISAVYEKPGSLKIGHYVPGTKIPILSDDILFNSTNLDDPILNLAWHIPQEIKKYLTDNLYAGKVIDLISKSDFV